MYETALIPCHFMLFFEVSGFLPRNRLAARTEPPGGITNFASVLEFGMNCLAAMNICQAARHCLRSFWLFIAVCMRINMVFGIDVCSLYWIPCWSEIN